MSDDDTRPVSVAELLARNGTIGSPPVGGHRRRKRRNAVSVAELTGELPVIRTGEIPVVDADEPAEFDEPESAGEQVTSETVVIYSSATEVSDTYIDEKSADAAPDYSDYRDYTPGYDETPDYGATPEYGETTTYVETNSYATSYVVAPAEPEPAPWSEPEAEVSHPVLPEAVAVSDEVVAVSDEVVAVSDEVVAVSDEVVAVSDEVVAERLTEPRIEAVRLPLSSIPLPRRRRGPERSHDPRARRRSSGPAPAPASRSSGAEQMSPDPVDEAVDLAELVAEQAPDPTDLRSYLKSSTATLFFGETVADDLARRGEVAEFDDYEGEGYDTGGGEYDLEDVDRADAPRRGTLSVLGTSLVAVLQSLLAVVFGAGLFIGFDQLWRWNNIVALALSALVIAALMIGVHVVRKTEDFVSILIAALVGILVTFGPLALQST